MRSAVRTQAQAGMPIYAECGGFMYLCRGLNDVEGRRHPMCNVYPFDTGMLKRRRALGYREVTFTAPNILGPHGTKGRGHEFHYSFLMQQTHDGACETCYEVVSRLGNDPAPEGYRVANTLGSYVHLHFGSNPQMARHWVEKCKLYYKERLLT